MKTPSFWKNKTLLSTALLPAGWIYAGLTALRLKLKKPCHAAIPVICVGNLTAGGSGKTPTAVSLAGILKRGGKNPFLYRAAMAAGCKTSLSILNATRRPTPATNRCSCRARRLLP